MLLIDDTEFETVNLVSEIVVSLNSVFDELIVISLSDLAYKLKLNEDAKKKEIRIVMVKVFILFID